MCLVYKCRNGLVLHLAETFCNVSDKHEHHTRAQTRQSLNSRVKRKNKQLIIIIINALFRKMVQTMSPTGDFQWAIYKKVAKYTIYICTFG